MEFMKIYYAKQEPMTINLGTNTITTERTHFFIPFYNLEIYGNSGVLFGYCDAESEGATVDTKSRNLQKSLGRWEARKLEEIPSKATPIEIDRRNVRRVVRTYNEMQDATRRFGEHFEETTPFLKAARQSDLRKYMDRFSEAVEEVLFVSVKKL